MFEATAVRETVANAAALLAPVATTDLWRLSDDDVESVLDQLLAVRAAADAATAAVLVEADNRSLRSRTQAPTTQRWLTQRMRLSRGQAERLVGQADTVTSQPAVLSSLAAGRCHLEQAVVVGTVLGELPTTVDGPTRAKATGLLLEQCAALDPMALARAGQRLVETLTTQPDTDDPAEKAGVEADAAYDLTAACNARFLSWRRRADGSVAGRFRLDPAGGQLFCSAISALSRRNDDKAGVLAGDEIAATEACGLTSPSTTDPRTGPQRRADALVTLARRAARAGELPDCGGVDTTLLVTTSLESLEGRTTAVGLLRYGGTLDPSALRMLACDAAVIPAVLGGAGQVLDRGRARRLFTPAQRRAIALRTAGASTPAARRHPSTATRTTGPRGTWAERRTSTTASCSAGTTTNVTIARAGPSVATVMATRTSRPRSRSTRGSNRASTSATR